VQIRVATIQDAAGIVSVINAAFHPAEGFVFDSDRIDLDGVRDLLQKGTFLIVEDRGALCGCVYLELRGDRSYLGLLSVDPRIQKTGLGAKLMDAAEAHCAKAGSRHMDLQIVSLRTEMSGFYRRWGYVESGTAPLPADLNPKLPCHFVKMSKALI
jgi:N-acetylglutamate synthase-like GNAT family acetyltransferase